MDKNLAEALKGQLKEEIASAYIYLAISADMEAKNLKGVAQWFRIQVNEEWLHAMKFYNYLIARGERAVLPALEKPQETWDSIKAAFETTLNHERFITKSIHSLVDKARAASDHATEAFLQWFVTEQVEEEAYADEIIQQIKLFGESPQLLFMLDNKILHN